MGKCALGTAMRDVLKSEIRRVIATQLRLRERLVMLVLPCIEPLRRLGIVSVFMGFSAIAGFRLYSYDSPLVALGWSGLVTWLIVCVWVCILTFSNRAYVSGPWSCLLVSDATLFYRTLRNQFRAVACLMVGLFPPQIAFGLHLGLDASAAWWGGCCLAMIQLGLAMLIGTLAFAWRWQPLIKILVQRRLASTLILLLIGILFVPARFAEMVDGLGLVLAWGAATTGPAVAVYYFPTLAIPIATVASAILIPLSVWGCLYWIRRMGQRFTISEFSYESRSDNRANGIYYEGTISGSSDGNQSVALQEDGWVEPEQTESSRPVPAKAGGVVAENESLSGESYLERPDTLHDLEIEPAELCHHYYRNRRRYRVWARVWFSSWKLRRDEIELLELRRAGALVPVNYNRLWIWIIGLTLGVSLLPEFLMFMLLILMIVLFLNSVDSKFNSDFWRIQTLPVNLRTALLAELKYYWIQWLPWIGVAFACAVVWAVRQSIPWDEFLLASLRVLFLLAAGLPCIIALASICNLHMQWRSWSALGWSILLLTSMTIATVGGFMMMFLDGVWALAGGVPAAFAAWALWESCIQYYECGVSDLK